MRRLALVFLVLLLTAGCACHSTWFRRCSPLTLAPLPAPAHPCPEG